MKSVITCVALLALLLAGPILLHRRADRASGNADDTLIIITPHNEATRYEIGRAFAAAHLAKTGRTLFVDWRATGGTSEIARYVAAQYLGSFRNIWAGTLHRPWTPDCVAFDDPKATAPDALAARNAFLESSASCGADVFFGGGSFDYAQMAAAGRLVDSGVIAAHPELFSTSSNGVADGTHIPQTLGGEALWDPKGCWLGVCLSSFGICYNSDSLTRLGIAHPPAEWADLADPAYAGQIALADPTQSGSVAKAFEMILQQQIAQAGGNVTQGWARGMALIQRIAANSRYFTDGATEIPYSVVSGDAAAGMCIDFYGRYESESVRRPDGSSRMTYLTPHDGSSTGADSVGLFRGAPHDAIAREFIEFLISPEGQKLWAFRAGTPGGPEKYTLRRLPIRPDLYASQYREFEADPEVNPFAPGAQFVYHPQWTSPIFGVISFAISTAFIQPHDELKNAWEALIRAHFPPLATATFADLSAIDEVQASGPIRAALKSQDKLDSVELARTLDDHFRDQYNRAAALAARGQ